MGARAETALSLGRSGSYQRLQLRQNSVREEHGGSFGNATGTPQDNMQLSLKIPLYISGTDANGPGTFYASDPFDVLTPTTGVGEFIGIAAEDLKDWRTYIPAFRMGHARSPFHLQVGALQFSLGHSSLVDHYTNTPIGASRALGFFSQLRTPWGGLAFGFSDIASLSSLVGGRAFIAPLSFFGVESSESDEVLELGLSWASDFNPNRGHPNHAAGVVDTRNVSGLSAEVTAGLWSGTLFKLRLYNDFNFLKGADSRRQSLDEWAFGNHSGLLGDIDILKLGVIQAQFDYTYGLDGYIPRYFDTLYAIERNQSYGTTLSKTELFAWPTHGPMLRIDSTWLDLFSIYGEWAHLFPRGVSADSIGRVLIGASFKWWVLGGALTLGQSGITTFGDTPWFGPGFIMTAEGRISLLDEWLQVVGRYYRVHEPDIDSIQARHSLLIGLEVRAGFKNPLP